VGVSSSVVGSASPNDYCYFSKIKHHILNSRGAQESEGCVDESSKRSHSDCDLTSLLSLCYECLIHPGVRSGWTKRI
jgi:hypothetical protein